MNNFKEWFVINEGMMKLPFEFIRPIIESYIESYKNFSPDICYLVIRLRKIGIREIWLYGAAAGL
jgi:hypothetical protein